jgi:pyruvate/2-oxoglutarate dehydrogenase complex dihydrolipoamide acyltransferase (E2) component
LAWRRRGKRFNRSGVRKSGATLYLSDLGGFAVVQAFDSIIPVGASAILSVAAADPMGAQCTLTCDHRVVFGADAAKFLDTLIASPRSHQTLAPRRRECPSRLLKK